MTKHECAVIMAYTGITMLKGDDLKHFYAYVNKLMGRRMHTIEIVICADDIKKAARDDFLKLCAEAVD